jgi:hypothetical protein
MSHRVKRTRLALGTLLLGAAVLAPGLAAAAPRTGMTPRAGTATAAGTATTAGAAERSVLGRFEELLRYLRGGRAPAGRPAPGLRSVHANAGCGIDPNGTHCP